MAHQMQPNHPTPGKQTRNGACPCGSGAKYKRCCGALGAQAAATDAQAPFLRGVERLQAGDIAAAKAMFLAAIRLDETHFGAFHALGVALLRSGQFAEAAGILTRALALNPAAAAAHHDLARAYDGLGLHEQAIDSYRKTVELSPRLGEAQHRLGELYVLYSRVEEASQCFERAADADRQSTRERLLRADARWLRGDAAGAEQWARKAVALDTASDAALGTLAGLLYAQGRFEDAAAHFEKALRLNPASAMCWDGLAHCRTYKAADSTLPDRMRAVLARGDLDDAARLTIHFALGKVLDDSEDYAGAMAQFDSGNALRARRQPFDRAALSDLAERTIALFTPDVFARCADLAHSTEKPLFIVGMYRSGTTLAEQILSSHRDIAAGGELTVWHPAEIEIDAATRRFDPVGAPAAVAKYLAVLDRIGPHAARVTDKLPFNFFRLGALYALMPHARIVHCRRDAVDTCLSIHTTLFKSPVGFAARRDDLVFCYRLHLRLMAHWRAVLPPGVLLDIDYESLIADREAETRRMVAHAGLDWDENCLRPERNARPIGTSSAWQARQPVYATSLQRWRRYAPWLGELASLIERNSGLSDGRSSVLPP